MYIIFYSYLENYYFYEPHPRETVCLVRTEAKFNLPLVDKWCQYYQGHYSIDDLCKFEI